MLRSTLRARSTTFRCLCSNSVFFPSALLVGRQDVARHLFHCFSLRAYYMSPVVRNNCWAPSFTTHGKKEHHENSRSESKKVENTAESRSPPPPLTSPSGMGKSGNAMEDFQLNAASWINQRRHNAMFKVESSSTFQRYWVLCGAPLIFLFAAWGVWWWWAYSKWCKKTVQREEKLKRE